MVPPFSHTPIAGPDKRWKAEWQGIDATFDKPFRRTCERARASTTPCSASAAPRHLRIRVVDSAPHPQACSDPRRPQRLVCSAPHLPAHRRQDCSVPHRLALLVRFLPPIRRRVGWLRRLEVQSVDRLHLHQQQGCGGALLVRRWREVRKLRKERT